MFTFPAMLLCLLNRFVATCYCASLHCGCPGPVFVHKDSSIAEININFCWSLQRQQLAYTSTKLAATQLVHVLIVKRCVYMSKFCVFTFSAMLLMSLNCVHANSSCCIVDCCYLLLCLHACLLVQYIRLEYN